MFEWILGTVCVDSLFFIFFYIKISSITFYIDLVERYIRYLWFKNHKTKHAN